MTEQAEGLQEAWRGRMRDLAIQTLRQSEMQKELARHIEELEEHRIPAALLKPLKSMGTFEANRSRFHQEFTDLFPDFEVRLKAAHPR